MPTDPAGWTAWDDLMAEFPTRRDAKIRALISRHRAAIEAEAVAAERAHLDKVRMAVLTMMPEGPARQAVLAIIDDAD